MSRWLVFVFMLDYSEEAICMNSSPLARGEKVRVVKGPLTGLVGELVNVDGKKQDCRPAEYAGMRLREYAYWLCRGYLREKLVLVIIYPQIT